MGYWKALFRSFIVLSVLSAISYGWAYLWFVILWKGTLTSFNWMYTFVTMLSIIYAWFNSDTKEE